MTTWVRKYSVFYIKLFRSTIVTRYSNMSQKDIQETISQLPEGSIFHVVVSETPYLHKVVDREWIYYFICRMLLLLPARTLSLYYSLLQFLIAA